MYRFFFFCAAMLFVAAVGIPAYQSISAEYTSLITQYGTTEKESSPQAMADTSSLNDVYAIARGDDGLSADISAEDLNALVPAAGGEDPANSSAYLNDDFGLAFSQKPLTTLAE